MGKKSRVLSRKSTPSTISTSGPMGVVLPLLPTPNISQPADAGPLPRRPPLGGLVGLDGHVDVEGGQQHTEQGLSAAAGRRIHQADEPAEDDDVEESLC